MPNGTYRHTTKGTFNEPTKDQLQDRIREWIRKAFGVVWPRVPLIVSDTLGLEVRPGACTDALGLRVFSSTIVFMPE